MGQGVVERGHQVAPVERTLELPERRAGRIQTVALGAEHGDRVLQVLGPLRRTFMTTRSGALATGTTTSSIVRASA